MPPSHWPSATQKLGAPPDRLPAPAPLTSTAPLHAQPRAAPRAPPASRPASARARPLAAAGPSPPRLHGAPCGATPARPEWAARRGGGVPGASPPPGRGHALAPRVTRVRAHAGPAKPSSVSPGPGGGASERSIGLRPGGGGSPSTSTPTAGPAAAGHCSSTKGPEPRRPPCPLRSSSRSVPLAPSPDTLSDLRGQRGRLRVRCRPLSTAAGEPGTEARRVPAPPPAARRRHTWLCGGGATWWRVRKTQPGIPPPDLGVAPSRLHRTGPSPAFPQGHLLGPSS